jgi:hypothetical protein
MSPQEFWTIADERLLDQKAGAGGLTRREIRELEAMLEQPKPKAAANA